MRSANRVWLYLALGIPLSLACAGVAYLGGSFWSAFGAALISIAAIVLVIEAIQVISEDRGPEEAEPPGDETGIGADLAGNLLDQLQLPLFVVNEQGRVGYVNNGARSFAPRIETGRHFSDSIRSPAFVSALKATLEDGQDRTADFQSSAGSRQLSARITAIQAGGQDDRSRWIAVQFDDRTAEAATDMFRSTFIANASHELRTPLAAIIGIVETLRGPARDDPEAREEFLAIMHEQGIRMQRLIDDLMALSNIELDQHRTPEGTCDVLRIARRAAKSIDPAAEGVSIKCRWPKKSEKIVRGNADQLMQVFMNLVDNAAKYGGGEVNLAFEQPDPRFPGMLGVSVCDNGSEIPREQLPHLTERFYRVDDARSREKGGSGLGLAIVKHILVRHRGHLEIRSSQGEGNRFTVWLPSDEPQSDGTDPLPTSS